MAFRYELLVDNFSVTKTSEVFGERGLLHDKEVYSCTSITSPEDELQQQLRKFVNKLPCPEETFFSKYSTRGAHLLENSPSEEFYSIVMWFHIWITREGYARSFCCFHMEIDPNS